MSEEIVSKEKAVPVNKKHKKKGPITIVSKLKATLHGMKDGQHSRLLKHFRKCGNCPLGKKDDTRIINNREMKFTKPAVCPYYNTTNKKCPIDNREYINSLKSFFAIYDEEKEEVAIVKELSKMAMADSIMSRDVEVVTKGHPGFYTDLHSRRAVEAAEKSYKMQYGDKSVVTQIQTTPDEVLDRIKKFKKDEDDVVDVEGKEVEEDV